MCNIVSENRKSIPGITVESSATSQMTDIVDTKTRSRMMAGIGPKDTRPELIIRHGLHSKGYRYRLHDNKLPGKPDLVFPRYKALIFINGCFWHGHRCNLFRWPSSRPAFWKEKIGKTTERDKRNIEICKKAGWRVMTIWECSLKGTRRIGAEATIAAASRWLNSSLPEGNITGRGA
jgi:DNA mismatch endonuclease, patch repair protein